jgi:cation diffusion facilitator family transporter
MIPDSYDNSENKIYITTENAKDTRGERFTSTAAVLRALAANLAIAGIKLACWFVSRSSAMLSESIHSGVDSFNSICLLVGLKRGSKPADKLHPYGYGLEANIWALFACVLMFMGTAVSIYSGVNRFLYNHEEAIVLLNNYPVIALTLLVSISFEIWALASASRSVLKEAEEPFENDLNAIIKSFRFIKKIKSPTTKFVWYEDAAALLGVIIAFVSLSISKFYLPQDMAYIPDAFASIIIGFILFALAIYLIKFNINSLTGAAAGPQTELLIKEITKSVNGVSRLLDLKTIDMGPSGLIINMKIEVEPETQVKDADDISEMVEKKVRERIKNISHVTIEMQAYDTEDTWEEKFDKTIDEGKQNDLLTETEAKMLHKFYDFTNTVVYEIMVPRPEVTFADVNTTINELIEIIISSGHTRIPVFKDNVDNIIGVVNAKDVLRVVRESSSSDFNIETLVREITIVPENKPISQMLSEFSSKKSQIAAIVDEHGGVAGIITVEDIIEEIVGEIYDEFDVVEISEYIALNENTVSVAAKVDIEDINEKYDLDLPTEDFQTLGGYVFGLLGREPEEGDEIEENGIKFKVIAVEGHKITRVLLNKPEGFIKTENQEQ